MKDTDFLYTVATLGLGSILAIFVCFGTGTLPTSTPRGAGAVSTTPAVKKKCGCCAKVTPEVLAERRRQNRALREKRQAYEKATQLITQYGREEGLRRLKRSHPEIAKHLEQFTEKHPSSQKD